jgi:hypothetical protein
MTALNLKITIHSEAENEADDEQEHEIPAKHEVCPRCEGFGTHLNPSIGGHAYTREEFDEAFSDEEEREQYFKRGGIYDVTCEECQGARVVVVPDEAACTGELRAILDTWQRQESERLRSEAQDRRMQWFEDGCPRD